MRQTLITAIILINITTFSEKPEAIDNFKNLTINVNNQFDPKSYTSSTCKQNVSLTALQQTDLIIKNLGRQIKNNFQGIKDIFRKYRFRIITASIMGSYAITLYNLAKGKQFLSKNNLWSCWPNTMTFEELLEENQQKISQELISSIQQHYINPKNPTDFITPLINFINDIEKEKKYISFYFKLYKTLNKIYLIKIFPHNKAIFLDAKEKLQRLSYIKNIFLLWAAKYKIKKNASSG